MANYDRNKMENDKKGGLGLLAGLALTIVGGIARSIEKDNKKESLQQELNEINHKLTNERNKGFFFRDDDLIYELEQRKRDIQNDLEKLR